MAAPVKYRITFIKAALLLFIAVFSWGVQVLCDLTGVLAVVSSIVGLIVGMLLPFLCGLMGVKFTPKIVTTFIVEGIIGILPFVDMFPSYVIGVAYVIVSSRREDRKKAEELAADAERITQQRLAVFAARRRLQEEELQAANDAYIREQEEAA